MTHAEIKKICLLAESVYNQDRDQDDCIEWTDVSVLLSFNDDPIDQFSMSVFIAEDEEEFETARSGVLDECAKRLKTKLERRQDKPE
jgi:hypothetical protein